MLQRDYVERSGKNLQVTSCFAVGTQDCGVSIWVTALKKRLITLKNLFEQPTQDLSWSPKGLQLIACSLDGKVVYIEFDEEEIGRPLTVVEKVSAEVIY